MDTRPGGGGKEIEEVVPDDLAVDGAGDAVLKLQVHLGDGVFCEDGGIGDITCSTHNYLSQLFTSAGR